VEGFMILRRGEGRTLGVSGRRTIVSSGQSWSESEETILRVRGSIRGRMGVRSIFGGGVNQSDGI
jgi:hypothetical protein